jgi:TP901 family phage tail tape measure protein
MAERTASVRLQAITSGFKAEMASARAAVTGFSADLTKQATDQKASFNEVGVGLLAIGTAAGVGVGMAVRSFANFDQAMSSVKATGADAAQSIDRLRQASLDAAAASQFSATQAAGGVEALAKAGVSATDILNGGLVGALNLAAAGQLGVGEAAEFTATALTQFNLAGDKASHVADVLAAGAGKAQGSVQDMALALSYVGGPAADMGVTLEETAGTIALFAQNGIIGEKAGTALRSMLGSLTGPSDEAADAMARLGINVFDAQGNFVGFEGIAAQLNESLAEASDAERSLALSTIFGNEARQAATVLTQAGAEGVRAWTAAVDDQGFAMDAAATKMDNLAGDVERLKGAFETGLIQTGSAANDMLRETVQVVTGAVDAYNSLPGPVQTSVLVLGGLITVVGLAGGAFLLAVPKIAAFNAAAAQIGGRTQAVGKGIGLLTSALTGPFGIALAAGAVGLGIWASKNAEAEAAQAELRGTLDQTTGAITEQTSALVAANLETSGLLEKANSIGIQQGSLTEAVLGDPQAAREVGEAIEAALSAFSEAYKPGSGVKITDELRAQKEAALALRAEYPQLAKDVEEAAESQRRLGSELGTGAGAASEATDAYAGLGESVESALTPTVELTDEQQALADSLGLTAGEASRLSREIDAVKSSYDELNGVNVTAIEAQIAYQRALAGAAQTVEDIATSLEDMDSATRSANDALNDTATGLDLTTKAGQDAQEALLAIADAGRVEAEGILERTGSQEQYRASLAKTREDLLAQAEAFGVPKEAAQAFIDTFAAMPEEVEIKLTVAEAEAAGVEAEKVAAKVRDIPLAWVTKTEVDTDSVAPSIDGAQRLIDSLKQGTPPPVDVNNKPAIDSTNQAQIHINGLEGVTRDVDVDPSGAISGTRSAQSAINGVYGKTVTINVQYRVSTLGGVGGGGVGLEGLGRSPSPDFGGAPPSGARAAGGRSAARTGTASASSASQPEWDSAAGIMAATARAAGGQLARNAPRAGAASYTREGDTVTITAERGMTAADAVIRHYQDRGIIAAQTEVSDFLDQFKREG